MAPTALHAAETVNTLQFADRAKRVMQHARSNVVVDDKVLLAQAQTEIARLKLLLKHALTTSAQGQPSSLNPETVFGDNDTSDEVHRLLVDNERLRSQVTRLEDELSNRHSSGQRGARRRRRGQPMERQSSADGESGLYGRRMDGSEEEGEIVGVRSLLSRKVRREAYAGEESMGDGELAAWKSMHLLHP